MFRKLGWGPGSRSLGCLPLEAEPHEVPMEDSKFSHLSEGHGGEWLSWGGGGGAAQTPVPLLAGMIA